MAEATARGSQASSSYFVGGEPEALDQASSSSQRSGHAAGPPPAKELTWASDENFFAETSAHSKGKVSKSFSAREISGSRSKFAESDLFKSTGNPDSLGPASFSRREAVHSNYADDSPLYYDFMGDWGENQEEEPSKKQGNWFNSFRQKLCK